MIDELNDKHRQYKKGEVWEGNVGSVTPQTSLTGVEAEEEPADTVPPPGPLFLSCMHVSAHTHTRTHCMRPE